MAKRGLNIYKRKDGRWEGRLRIPASQGGKGKYRSVYGRSWKGVRERLLALAAEQGRDDGTEKCTLTVNEVVDMWIRDKKGAWKESTYACYIQIVERHIREGVGRQRADGFTNVSFQSFLDSLRRKGDGAKISPSYAHGIGTIIRQAYSHAVSEYHYALPQLKARSLQKSAEPVEVPSDSTMDKLMRHLAACPEDSTCLGVLLACCTGIRIGELCALTWGDVDLDEGVLRISRNMQRIKDCREGASGTKVRVQTPKTAGSARRIPLPDTLLRILRENRRPAGEYIVKGRKKLWAEARTVQYRFAAILKACGIRRFRFHALRHYFASLCIRQGFDVKSLSEILGHVNTQITMNLYVHSTMEQKRSLMNGVFCTGAV